ncbi:efflux RND transporter periplasmic adaptor subunit [Sinorhizobium meliloti]|uniref:efflux RND transporter periplasmic adaptor subunit n=1 Tax=Rhizobium meliloti TaxID=382 RepID=UPI000FD87E56|nr:efflux RND transporter periplasmic adaptor subunit [Sinorhizobium meliloti]RVG73126.1 efflux RND transporter periplasmic adaptor subunit [Sinorhizobium meliloti]
MRVNNNSRSDEITAKRLIAILAACVSLVGCDDQQKELAPPEARAVRVTVVAHSPGGEPFSLTGHIRAQNEAALAFRIDGRLKERHVDVGARVAAGKLVARLESHNERNAYQSAHAALTAARATLDQVRGAFERQRSLLARGFTTRAQFEQAEKALLTAQSQAASAEADLQVAKDRLDDTELRADAPGVVGARGAEVGEVVRAGQMVYKIARHGGRDAVFDVPSVLLRRAATNPEVTVTLVDEPAIRAMGRVREVSPQADHATGTFRVRIGLSDPPAAMRLGSAVTGRVELGGDQVIELPATALTEMDGRPAVWLVDPATRTVALRVIEVARYSASTVIVAQGLEDGEIVVTAGVQALRPGQNVRLLGAEL